VISRDPSVALHFAETFNFLRQYAREHFSTEELLMTKTEYSGYQSHRAQHEFFLHHVENLYEQMRKVGFSPDRAREIER
jgi:hemerythrin-like metal-binding protein